MLNFRGWTHRLHTTKTINALTINDTLFWGGIDVFNVVFAIFVLNDINGGSAATVGIAFFLYKFASTLVSIPIGEVFDDVKGLVDENWGLAVSGFLSGMLLISLAQAWLVWHVYLIMALMGISRSLNLNSWRKLFNKFLDKRKTGTEFAYYDTILSLLTGLLTAVAGLMSDRYSPQAVLLFAGLLMLSSSVFTFFIRKEVTLFKE